MTTHFNRFGQAINVGDVVGWGHRSGNQSHQHIGIVLNIQQRGDTIKTLCAWVEGPNTPRRSATTDQLFVLDTKTLSSELYSKIVQTAAQIVAEQEEKNGTEVST